MTPNALSVSDLGQFLPAAMFARRFVALAGAIGLPSGPAGYGGLGLQSHQRMAA